ncbi:BLOC-1-related complex subunit 5-like [Symsagittifera roscoffensis]|uniref:BLOC-1-related complex subunit 5-like n=1 Tax=Symsagittifera roscoffensis TaxID=84072 RepID=UPI00307CB4E7
MGADQSKGDTSAVGEITVVNQPSSGATIESDEDYERISNLPSFEPILRTHIIEEAKLSHMDRLNPVNLAKVVNRCSVHLNDCDSVLLAYQHKLGLKVKESEQKAKLVANLVHERQKKMQRSTLSIQKIDTVQSDLKRLLATFEQMVKLCDELNMGLPESQRLEPFNLTERASFP